jgi:cation:H+ antiporter
MIAVLWFIAGIALLIAGAELCVRGGSRLAARLGIPPIIIGLTIVAVGTSVPELAVGIEAARSGNPSIAIGNIAGTNTVNILLILGLSALLDPLALRRQTIRFDLPAMVITAVVLIVMVWNRLLSQAEGSILVGAGILYTVAIVYLSRRESRAARAHFTREYSLPPDGSTREQIWNISALFLGIAMSVLGADWFVDGAVGLARWMGVSDAFIGLTIVAIGTSAPELVTTIIGTLKHERDIAVGNLIGSSVYNILVILGVTCLFAPSGIPVEPNLILIDIPVMAGVAFICIPVFMSGRQVTRVEGGLFVASYIAYLTYLIVERT